MQIELKTCERKFKHIKWCNEINLQARCNVFYNICNTLSFWQKNLINFFFWQHIKLYALHNGSFKANITLIQVPLQLF